MGEDSVVGYRSLTKSGVPKGDIGIGIVFLVTTISPGSGFG